MASFYSSGAYRGAIRRDYTKTPSREEAPVMRVAGTTDVNNMAFTIESRLFDAGAVRLEAIGAGAVNQATKAIATVLENIYSVESLCVYPEFVQVPVGEDEKLTAIDFFVFLSPPLPRYHGVEQQQQPQKEGEGQQTQVPQGGGGGPTIMRVAHDSDTKSLATAISTELRAKGEVGVQAVGPEAVNNAVKAICTARRIERDAGGADVGASPDFVRIPAPSPDQGEHTALLWTVAIRNKETTEPEGKPALQAFRNPPPIHIEDKIAKADATISELRVAGWSDPRMVGAAVAARMHKGETVRITVIGAASVNQTIKALAIARAYLEQAKGDFATFPHFTTLEGPEEVRDMSALHLTLVPCAALKFKDDDAVEYRVAASTIPNTTANAIFNDAGAKKTVKLEVMGVQAVNQGVKAVAIARQQMTGLPADLAMAPVFRSVETAVGLRTALELSLVPITAEQ